MLRSARTLIGLAAAAAHARDRPSPYGNRGALFLVVRGTGPRNRTLILCILKILAILLQTIAIKVRTDLFSVLRLRAIDIKVFQTFFSLILCILCILAILLQTDKRHGEGQAHALRKSRKTMHGEGQAHALR